MNSTVKAILSLTVLGLTILSGCQPQEEQKVVPQESKTIKAQVYSFMESEPGIEPYPVRMIVTDGFMRLDEGKAEDNFLLFNRADNSIHSVTHRDQTVLRMQRRKGLAGLPESVDLGVREMPANDMPQFAGQVPKHFRYTSGDKTCYETVSIPDFGADAVSAMKGYLLTLSGEQIQNLEKTPGEMRSDCMMANLIYAPIRHLEPGFPLREWGYNGYLRELVNVETVDIDSALLMLNPAYKIYQLAPSGMPALVN